MNNKDLLKEEYDEILKHNRLQRRKKRKKRKLIALSIILALISLYLLAPISNVKSVLVENNYVYSEDIITQELGISLKSKSYLQWKLLLQGRLKNLPLIDDIKIDGQFSNNLKVTVYEKEVVAYYEKEGTNYLLLADGSISELNDYNRLLTTKLPYAINYDENSIQLLGQHLKGVKHEVLFSISEIRHYSVDYNANMNKLIMNDGNIIYTTLGGLKLLNNYGKIRSSLSNGHKCIIFNEETNSAHTQNCDEIQY